jgi:hypothetical protein
MIIKPPNTKELELDFHVCDFVSFANVESWYNAQQGLQKKETIKWGINYHQLPIDKPKGLSFSNVQQYNFQSQDILTFIMDGGTKWPNDYSMTLKQWNKNTFTNHRCCLITINLYFHPPKDNKSTQICRSFL